MEGRIPPHSDIAEQSLLGAMILDSYAINDAAELLSSEAFYNKSHGLIFGAILTLFNSGKAVDLITLSDYLSSQGTLEAVGGLSYLTVLTDQGVLTTNAKQYAAIIDEKFTLRQLIRVSSKIMEEGYAGSNADELIERAEKSIFDITQRQAHEGLTHIREVVDNTFTTMEKLYAASESLTGITTGLTDLDHKTAGLQKSELVLLAARPSMGKTALGINICTNAAKSGQKVAMFSLEMGKEQYVQRIFAAESFIELSKIKTGQFEDDDWYKIVKTTGVLSNLDIYIDDTPAITVTEIRAKCRRLKIEHGLDLIMVDYLQLMSGAQRAENRQQEISAISRGLKAIARELQCPLLALSQLSRAPEQRSDHRPMLSDLRESGAIEQDADIVMFLYRGEYYEPDKEELKNVAELIIAKQRSGETGTVHLHWMGQYQLFRDLAKRDRY